jgi:hypothetical protein
MLKDRAKKALSKKARKGFAGYPVATVAFYGPTDKRATKLVAGIIAREGAAAEPLRKWYSEGDLRNDPQVMGEVSSFIREHEAKSVAMADRIIGCPHEEGIDYPEGEACPQCPFWRNRDRWSGETQH